MKKKFLVILVAMLIVLAFPMQALESTGDNGLCKFR